MMIIIFCASPFAGVEKTFKVTRFTLSTKYFHGYDFNLMLQYTSPHDEQIVQSELLLVIVSSEVK